MAELKVNVTKLGNKLVCIPNETHAKRGDVIVWEGPVGGPLHTGRFLGRLKEVANDPAKPPAKKSGFKLEDLRPENLDSSRRPAQAREWANADRVAIRADAANGVYAYLVEVRTGPGPNDKIDSDPVVIIED